MSTSLEGRRALVVGASSGIGRALGPRLTAAGARIALAARREAPLREAIAEAGGGTALVADISSGEGRSALADGVRASLGRLDLVIITAATARLRPLDRMTVADWSVTVEANVVGTNLAIAELLPLLADGAIVVVLSSDSAGRPFYGLGAYAASKSAIEDTMRAWRVEQPHVRFMTLVVGVTTPTDFASGFDVDELTSAMDVWAAQGNTPSEFMSRDDVAAVMVDLLATLLPRPGVGVETVVLRSPSPLTGSSTTLTDRVEEHGLHHVE